jgi:hypothetical protein
VQEDYRIDKICPEILALHKAHTRLAMAEWCEEDLPAWAREVAFVSSSLQEPAARREALRDARSREEDLQYTSGIGLWFQVAAEKRKVTPQRLARKAGDRHAADWRAEYASALIDLLRVLQYYQDQE